MRQQSHVVDVLFSLALFCVLTATALLVVVLGANVYKQTVAGMTQNYNTRTSISYLAEKIRQNDAAGCIAIGEVDGADALILEQKAEQSDYQTWIYSSGGKLCEVMVAGGTNVKAADGQPIMDLADLKIDWDAQGMLQLTATDIDGAVTTLKLSIRCKS